MSRGSRILACLVAVLALPGCNAAEERDGARGTVGYTVTPPEGWQDVTRAVDARSGARFDVAYEGPVGGGAEANLNIARRDAGRSATLPGLVREGRAEVEELGGGELDFSEAAPVEIDGEPALQYDFVTDGARVRQVGALHRGGYYVVTLTAATPAFPRAVTRLDGLLRSWQWD